MIFCFVYIYKVWDYAIYWKMLKIYGIHNTMFNNLKKTLNHLKIKDMKRN